MAGQRQRDVRIGAGFRSEEAARRHAHDGEGDRIQRDVAPGDRWVAVKGALPEPVADDGGGGGWRAGNVVGGFEQSSEKRPDTQDAKVIAGNELALDGDLGAAGPQMEAAAARVGEQIGGGLAAVAKQLELRIGKGGVQVGAHAVAHHHQALGLRNGQRLEEQRIQEREHGGRGAQTERQRNHDRRADTGTAHQNPRAEAQVLEAGFHPRPSPRLAYLLLHQQGVSKRTLGGTARFLGRQAAGFQLGCLQLQIGTQLALQVPLAVSHRPPAHFSSPRRAT